MEIEDPWNAKERWRDPASSEVARTVKAQKPIQVNADDHKEALKAREE